MCVPGLWKIPTLPSQYDTSIADQPTCGVISLEPTLSEPSFTMGLHKGPLHEPGTKHGTLIVIKSYLSKMHARCGSNMMRLLRINHSTCMRIWSPNYVNRLLDMEFLALLSHDLTLVDLWVYIYVLVSYWAYFSDRSKVAHHPSCRTIIPTMVQHAKDSVLPFYESYTSINGQ